MSPTNLSKRILYHSGNRGIKSGTNFQEPRYAFVSQETYHIHLSSITLIHYGIWLYEDRKQVVSKKHSNMVIISSCGSLNFSNPITFYTIFFMMLFNCYSGRGFQESKNISQSLCCKVCLKFLHYIHLEEILGTFLVLSRYRFLNDEHQ
jgi:hypothetical protein